MGKCSGLCRADAAIVGGGLTGLLLGASLTHEGMRVVILDAGSGASQACTGAATIMIAPVLQRIEAVHGAEAARQHASALQSQLTALTTAPLPYVQETPVYAFALHRELEHLKAQHALLMRMGLPVSIAPDAGGCPFPVALALVMQGQALVDVPRWMAALRTQILRSGGSIYGNSRVISVEDSRVCTAHGRAEAPLIILATGKPIGLRDRRLLSLLETHLIARCSLTGPFPLHSIQRAIQPDGLTLLPAAGEITAVWDMGRLGVRRQQARLKQFTRELEQRLPDWSRSELTFAPEVFSLDGLPVIGTLPGSRVLCACGYNGCGVLGAMHAASLLTRRILGHSRPEDAAYSPDRKLPAGSLRPPVQTHALGLLRRSAPPCPHCSCRMRYSIPAQEWECPWCGSAYTMLGHVLSGPAMRPAKVTVRQRPDL